MVIRKTRAKRRRREDAEQQLLERKRRQAQERGHVMTPWQRVARQHRAQCELCRCSVVVDDGKVALELPIRCRHGFWRASDGRTIAIRDLDPRHFQNIVRVLTLRTERPGLSADRVAALVARNYPGFAAVARQRKLPWLETISGHVERCRTLRAARDAEAELSTMFAASAAAVDSAAARRRLPLLRMPRVIAVPRVSANATSTALEPDASPPVDGLADLRQKPRRRILQLEERSDDDES